MGWPYSLGAVWLFRVYKVLDALPDVCTIRLGAGAMDAALNNYVALHYSSRHMSWLHAFWGGLPALAG